MDSSDGGARSCLLSFALASILLATGSLMP